MVYMQSFIDGAKMKEKVPSNLIAKLDKSFLLQNYIILQCIIIN